MGPSKGEAPGCADVVNAAGPDWCLQEDKAKAGSDFGLKVIFPQIPLGTMLLPHLSVPLALILTS